MYPSSGRTNSRPSGSSLCCLRSYKHPAGALPPLRAWSEAKARVAHDFIICGASRGVRQGSIDFVPYILSHALHPRRKPVAFQDVASTTVATALIRTTAIGMHAVTSTIAALSLCAAHGHGVSRKWPTHDVACRAAGGPADVGNGRPSQGAVVVYDMSDQVVDYEVAWAWQRGLLSRAVAAVDEGPRGTCHAVLLLQHPPVYTLGAGSTTDNLRFPPGSPPIPLHRTERGGEVTYHGPGQLVMYPILDLQALRPDLHWYLRKLEQVVVEALDSVSGLSGERVEGLTGVWVGGAKVAAIGVRAKRWISYHGLALNVVTDLAPFSGIVPCGIADRPVTSVARLLAERQAQEDPFAPSLEVELRGEEGAPEEMIPLTEATQGDLRRMLARTGMTPPVLVKAPAPTAAGPSAITPAYTAADSGAADLMDDPFAPTPQGSSANALEPAPPPNRPPSDEGALADVDSDAANPAGAAASDGRLRIRQQWTEGERQLLREYSCALLEALSEVFGLELVAGDPAELQALAKDC